MLNLSNFKRREKKFKKDKEMIKVERRDSEELLIKSTGTIDVLWKPASDHMDRKDH